MKMLLQVTLPNEKFNTAVKDGTINAKMSRILEETRPEATYFAEFDGKRCAFLIVDVKEPSRVPSIAEPWFLTFDAEVKFHVVMSPDDLGKAGLNDLGKKWT